jgi:hypothetical protein
VETQVARARRFFAQAGHDSTNVCEGRGAMGGLGRKPPCGRCPAYDPPTKNVRNSSSASPSAHTSLRLAMAAGMCCSKWGLPRLRLRLA